MLKLEIAAPATHETGANLFDYLKLGSDLVGTVAWPVAAIIIVIIFRKQLISLASRVKELNAPGINATFENELEKTRVIAESVPSAENDAAELDPASIDVSSADLAKTYPEAAILQAFHQIEKTLRSINPERSASYGAFLNALTRLQIIRAEDHDLFNQIRRTRNAAVHSERPITTGEALEYQALTNVFLETLNNVKPEIEARREDISIMLFKPRLLRA